MTRGILCVMAMLRIDQDHRHRVHAADVSRPALGRWERAYIYGLFTLSALANALVASNLWLSR
jgi:hypothetical protein